MRCARRPAGSRAAAAKAGSAADWESISERGVNCSVATCKEVQLIARRSVTRAEEGCASVHNCVVVVGKAVPQSRRDIFLRQGEARFRTTRVWYTGTLSSANVTETA